MFSLEPRELRQAAQDDVAVVRVEFDAWPRRPVRWAATSVVPEPAKTSITVAPVEQSRIASATIATGLTVGCMASSSSRVALGVAPAYRPDRRPVAAVLAEFDIVDVRAGAGLKDSDQLVLRAVE